MTDLTRYRSLDDMLGELSKGFWLKPVPLPGGGELKMKLDLSESEKGYAVKADIPGVKKEDIHVDIDGNTVSIRAEVKRESEEKEGAKLVHSERYYGALARSFTLPVEVDPQGASAEYKDGVLRLTLPKKTGASSRRLSVS